MSIVIVIAPTDETAATAWASLQQSNVADAEPSRRERLTPLQVQQLMLKTLEQRRSAQPRHMVSKSTETNVPKSPLAKQGLSTVLEKIWNELATDLLLGNVDHAKFGWCQTLDEHTPAFWQGFDPETRFVLVYEDPTAHVARVIEQDPVHAQNLQDTLQHWHTRQTQLLDIFYALGESAVLVHSSQIECAKQFLGLTDIANPSKADAHTQPTSAVLCQLLKPLVEADEQVQTLWQELEAAAQGPLHETWLPLPAAKLALTQFIQQQALQIEQASKTNEQEEVLRLEAQEETELLLNQLHQVQEELEHQVLTKLTQDREIEQLHQTLAVLQNQINDNGAKNDTALAQSEALGHELSVVEAQCEQLRQSHQQLQDEFAGQTLALQNETAKNLEAQSQLENLKQELTQIDHQSSEAQEEAELFLNQLHEVQEELEHQVLAKLEQDKKIEELHQTLAILQNQISESGAKNDTALAQSEVVGHEMGLAEVQCEQLRQAHQQLQEEFAGQTLALQNEAAEKLEAQNQLEALKQELTLIGHQHSETQEEVDLLLNQLHQVQEELEHYFLKYQDQRKQVESVVDFWHQHPPAEVWVDMRRTPDGHGWYEAEADGRWSGPVTQSEIELPPLPAGQHLVELHIADAMAPELVAGLQLTAHLNDGQVLELEMVHEFGPAENLYPMVSSGLLQLPDTKEAWHLRMELPEIVSPAFARGGDDTRLLGLRIQGVRLSLQLINNK